MNSSASVILASIESTSLLMIRRNSLSALGLNLTSSCSRIRKTRCVNSLSLEGTAAPEDRRAPGVGEAGGDRLKVVDRIERSIRELPVSGVRSP
jgi:hypothetical protein